MAPITSIAANVIGDCAEIVGIVPEGTNSHTFEPPPSAAEVMTTADVVFINGLAARGADQGAGAGQRRRRRADHRARRRDDRPRRSTSTTSRSPRTAASRIRTCGPTPRSSRSTPRSSATRWSAEAPECEDDLNANYDAFVEIVDEFDVAIREAFDTIPEDQRKLVTYHDAYAYFADTYGWNVIGAVQPADFGDPTPADVVSLIEQIEAEQVPAIFGSEVFPSPILEQIAEETGAVYVDDLRDDDLPDAPGDENHSWLGLMKFNFITMTEALGGDASALADFEVRNTVPDDSVLPTVIDARPCTTILDAP